MRKQILTNTSQALYKVKFQYRFAAIGLMVWSISWIVIGLSSPSNYYSPLVSKYLNYPQLIRVKLLKTSEYMLGKYGYTVHSDGAEFLLNEYGGGVHLAYACIGFGIASIWVAFMLSYGSMSFSKRTFGVVIGLLLLFFMNVIRICLLFTNKERSFWGIEHHNLYNYITHIILFAAMLSIILLPDKLKRRKVNS